MWKGSAMFCLPHEAGNFSAPVSTHRTSLRAPSSLLLPSVSFHISKPKQTLYVVEGTFSCVWSSRLVHGYSEHGPFGFMGLSCEVNLILRCLLHSTSRRWIPNTITHQSYFLLNSVHMGMIYALSFFTSCSNAMKSSNKTHLHGQWLPITQAF